MKGKSMFLDLNSDSEEVSERRMVEVFTTLMNKIVENMNKPKCDEPPKRKLTVNIDVIPMNKGKISVFAVRLKSNNIEKRDFEKLTKKH
jgi:hypothetical protein